MNILICGAGPAGLALAHFLDKTHKVTIIERSNTFSTMGFGIFFFNEGRQLLKKATHNTKIIRYLKEIGYKQYQTQSGKKIADVHYNKLFHVQHKNSITSIKRGDLHMLLRSKLPEHVTLLMGTTVRKLENTTNAAVATLSNGKTEIYDLVIGAEGAQSSLREQFFSYRVQQLPWRARYFWLNKTIVKYTISCGKHATVMCMPHKKNTTILAIENMNKDVNDTICPELGALYKSFGMKKADIAAVYADSYTAPMRYIFTKKWFNKSIVLIGDAQHAMTPTLGYGTSLALDDAYELAQCIHKEKMFVNKEQLLQYFARQRTRRVRMVRTINRMADFILFKNSKLYYTFWYSHKRMTYIACETLDALVRLSWKFSK